MVGMDGLAVQAHAATFDIKSNTLGTSYVYSYVQLKEALDADGINKVVVPMGASITVSEAYGFSGNLSVAENRTLLVEGDLTVASNGYWETMTNDGNVIVSSGGTLGLSGRYISISNDGMIDIQEALLYP